MRGLSRIGKSAAIALILLGFWQHARSAEASDGAPLLTVPTEPSSPAETLQEISRNGLPCPIPDSPLIAQAIALYEGPFWEDGGECETVCTGLLVTNTSDTMIEYAKITLAQNGQTLSFEITYFPPGSDLLVLEKDQTPFSEAPVERLCCPRLSYFEGSLRSPQVYVSPYGACSMVATNLTDRPLETVNIFYKHYFTEENLYIGGITYQAILNCLQPGESRSTTAYHFLSDQGKILLYSAIE